MFLSAIYVSFFYVFISSSGTLYFCPNLNNPQLKRLPRPPVCRALDAQCPEKTGAKLYFDSKNKVKSEYPQEKCKFKLEYPKPHPNHVDLNKHRLGFKANENVAVHEDGTIFYCEDAYGPCPAKPNRLIFAKKNEEDED